MHTILQHSSPIYSHYYFSSIPLRLARRNLPSIRPRNFPRAEMTLSSSSSSSSKAESDIPPIPENWIVVGCGMLSVDYLVTVDAFPKPDEKIRSKSMKVAGGGNTGNALTAAARLGLKPRLISKISNDVLGGNVMTELESDGVDTSYIVCFHGGLIEVHEEKAYFTHCCCMYCSILAFGHHRRDVNPYSGVIISATSHGVMKTKQWWNIGK